MDKETKEDVEYLFKLIERLQKDNEIQKKQIRKIFNILTSPTRRGKQEEEGILPNTDSFK
jgi:hypothetical protein